jgi:hypothetical protein
MSAKQLIPYHFYFLLLSLNFVQEDVIVGTATVFMKSLAYRIEYQDNQVSFL